MKTLLRRAFPLQWNCILYGLAEAAAFHIVLAYPTDLPTSLRGAILFAPMALLYASGELRRGSRLRYTGWFNLGILAGAIPYDYLVPEAVRPPYRSSLKLSLFAVAFLALDLLLVYLRHGDLKETSPEEAAEERAKEAAEQAWKELEERRQKIDEENSYHRR